MSKRYTEYLRYVALYDNKRSIDIKAPRLELYKYQLAIRTKWVDLYFGRWKQSPLTTDKNGIFIKQADYKYGFRWSKEDKS